jgi:hypothetical protein
MKRRHMSEADKRAAKHAEIDARYRAKRKKGWDAMPRHKQIAALRRGQLLRLMAVRSVRIKTEAELEQMIAAAAGINWTMQKPVEIAHRLDITIEEKWYFDLRNFPSIATKEEEAAYLRTARKASGAEYQRLKRQQTKINRMETTKMVSDLSVRDEVIHQMLKAHRRWVTIRWMMRKVEGLAAFKRPDGKALRGASLKTRVHEACNRLVAAELVDKKRKSMPHAFRVLFRWKSDRTAVQAYKKRVASRKDPHEVSTTTPSALTCDDASSHVSYSRRATPLLRAARRSLRETASPQESRSLRESGTSERRRSSSALSTVTTSDAGGKTVH